MTHHRIPRLLTPLLLVVLAATALAACGDDGAVTGANSQAFSVGEQSMTREELNAQLREWQTITGTEATSGEGAGTLSQGFVADRIAVNIQYIALIEELDARGIEVTEAHRSAARTDVESQIEAARAQAQGQATGTESEGEDAEQAEPSEAFTDLLVEWIAASIAATEEFASQPTEADIEAAYEEYPESICSAHILVETEQEANEILGLLDDGGDFATLAQERSIDTQSGAQGGELGCVPMGSFVPAFEEAAAAAEPGEVTAPVETEFGFHLIRVDSVGVPPLSEVRAQISQQLAQQAQGEAQAGLESLLREAVEAVEVTVDDRYGTWDPEQLTVVPPEGSTPETTVVPAGENPLEAPTAE